MSVKASPASLPVRSALSSLSFSVFPSLSFSRSLPFYSTRHRSEEEEKDDASLGTNRLFFSNLAKTPFEIGALTATGSGLSEGDAAVPLFLHDLSGVLVKSSENYFQAAKCQLKCDAEFVARHCSPGDAARFGQGRMELSDKQKALLVSLGADEDEFILIPEDDGATGTPAGAGAGAGTGAGAAGGDGSKKKSRKKAKMKWRRNSIVHKGRMGHPLRRDDWEAVKPVVMMEALRLKFHPDGEPWKMCLKSIADAGGGVFFVEHTSNDLIWADAGDGRGSNFLGKLLTQLVQEHINGVGPQPIDFDFLRLPNSTFCRYDDREEEEA